MRAEQSAGLRTGARALHEAVPLSRECRDALARTGIVGATRRPQPGLGAACLAADRALELIAAAIDSGFDRANLLREEPRWAALHEDPAFLELTEPQR